MQYLIYLFCIPILLISQELEVRLSTRHPVPPIYVSDFGSRSAELESMRSVLEFDLNMGGRCRVMARNPSLENLLKRGFKEAEWKKEQIPFSIACQVEKSKLVVTAYNVNQGTYKKYSAIDLRRDQIHKLADRLQRDLFGVQGIASLKLIYTERKKNPKGDGLDFLSEVWISDYDGMNPKQITNENSYCLSPSFLPNSSEYFYYASEKSGQTKIYRASLSQAKGELLVDLRGNQALPNISRDGKWIAYISDIAGRPDLFVQKLDKEKNIMGKPRQLFSAPRATQATPTFSPDGSQIAFVSDKDGPPRIYVLKLSSKGRPRPHLITRRNRQNTSPAWSPDGTKLAYSAKVDGVRQIWIYDFTTDEELPLTTGPKNKENPAWAPDSFHLVYNTESADECNLYLTHLNCENPVQIGSGSRQLRFASWQQN